MNKISLKQAAQLLLSKDKYLILCHRYPDGDTIGSAFSLCRALRSIGKKANVMCADIIPSKYSYIYEDLEGESFRIENVIAVDVADAKLLGPSVEKEYGKRVMLCIDHHGSNTGYAENLLLDSTAAAAGEIIWRLIRQLGVTPDIKMGEAVYTAISTDTGCFRYSNTTSQTFRLASELLELGVDTVPINKLMFETKSKARIEIERGIYKNLEYWFGGKVAVISLTDEMIRAAGAGEGDLENIAAMSIKIEGVKVGITFRQCDGGFKVSVRSLPGISACDICKEFGGGGHVVAAGCTIPGDLDMAMVEMQRVLEKHLAENFI